MILSQLQLSDLGSGFYKVAGLLLFNHLYRTDLLFVEEDTVKFISLSKHFRLERGRDKLCAGGKRMDHG